MGLYISLILNHLYIIHYIFNQIIQIINVKEGGKCPGVPSKVVLPPSYQTIIQKYFQTQQNDIKSINQKMRVALPMFNAVKKGLVGVKTAVDPDTFNLNKNPTPEAVGLKSDTANPISKEPSNISKTESTLGIKQEGGAGNNENELTNDQKHLRADGLNNERKRRYS